MAKAKDDAVVIAKLIRTEREDLEISKDYVSRRIPISRSHLDNIEAGRTLVTVPVLTKLYKIFKAHGCKKSLEYFVSHYKTREEVVEEVWKAKKMNTKVTATRKLPFEAKEEILRDRGFLT